MQAALGALFFATELVERVGIDDVLTKPYDMHKLVGVVTAVLVPYESKAMNDQLRKYLQDEE